MVYTSVYSHLETATTTKYILLVEWSAYMYKNDVRQTHACHNSINTDRRQFRSSLIFLKFVVFLSVLSHYKPNSITVSTSTQKILINIYWMVKVNIKLSDSFRWIIEHIILFNTDHHIRSQLKIFFSLCVWLCVFVWVCIRASFSSHDNQNTLAQ